MLGGSRNGITAKKKFLADLTEVVNSLGVAPRSCKQIDQKIRDEIKILKRYSNAMKMERSRTGGGKPRLPRLSEVQKKAFERLEEKPRLSGINCGQEVGQKSVMETEQKQPLRPRRTPPKSPTTLPEMNRVSSAALMKGEMENITLRREALKRKIILLDLQIEYWSKKAKL